MRKLTAAFAVLLAAACLTAPAQAQGLQAGQTFGDWAVQCPRDAQPNSCVVSQLISNQQNNQPVLQASIRKVMEQGKASLQLRLTGPLGVILPPGVAVQIDDNQAHRVPFMQCTQQGCYTVITLSDQDIGQLKAGQVMKVGMTPPGGQMEGIPVSLNGITAALNALRN